MSSPLIHLLRKLDTWKTSGTPPMLGGFLFEGDKALEKELTSKNFEMNVQTSSDDKHKAVSHKNEHKKELKYPKHVLISLKDQRIVRVVCDMGRPPSLACLHVSVIEANDLPVPHRFANFWNVESVSPFVRVSLDLHQDDRMERRSIDTSVITQEKMRPFSRSATNPLFYQTCCFENIPPIIAGEVQHVSSCDLSRCRHIIVSSGAEG